MKKECKVLNIDLSKINDDVIAELIKHVEAALTSYLNDILGPRLTDFNIVIGVEVKESELTVSIDIEIKTYFSNKLNLESILDSALRRAFNAAELFLSKFGVDNKSDKESK